MSHQPFRMAGMSLAAVFAAMLMTQIAAHAAPRTFSFHVGHSCTCASCAFEAPRELKKLAGVQKTTLVIKDHRLDVLFDDTKTPISALANAIGKLDMGKDSTMIWTISATADAGRATAALGRIPGVRSATFDAKAHVAYVAFKPRPAVTTAQIETALKEGVTLEGKD